MNTQTNQMTNEIPSMISVLMPAMFRDSGAKVRVIKALRVIAGIGLKEAKDCSESPNEQSLKVVAADYQSFHEACEDLTRCGVKTGIPVIKILHELRDMATYALANGEDEIANEILQLILAEKLRRRITL